MSDSDPYKTGVYEDEQAAPSADAVPINLPPCVGRYRVERLLGKGGFGLVYLAHDEQLGRPVAIKVPHANLLSRPENAELYLNEARTVAHLDHPAIVPVYDVGTTDEFPFFVVSKYIEGADLATTLQNSRLSHPQAAELVATVAEAFHYAHKQGLVHRDIKPGNILIDKSGKPFVVDFGLALREQDVGHRPSYVGTPSYMSPEQARGEGHRVDGRSDIFSLGVVFYELVVGRRPFRADSRAGLLDEIISQEPRPLRQYDDTVPKELERICLKMLSKRASERYPTAKDVAEDLRDFLQGPGVAVASHSANASSHRTPVEPTLTGHTPAVTPASGGQPIKIVPKGLRSFDEHDADFFLELLPGPRDREGLPESIRFWKTRMEETDADRTFSVGMIYGPSGCGKSSLVKAGLLPRLSKNVISVYLEATPGQTESHLLSGLRKHCAGLRENLRLKETLAALRRGQGISVGKKVLIVLDQFEQWLHATNDAENTELVQALRQCDGGHVQCMVMVRDDFWMATTRFMRELEIRLLEGHNSAPVDLFPVRHAEKVLNAFGRAFGVVPDAAGEATKDHKQFVEQAVHGLAQEGKIVCVRLALFAEMTKDKPWTLASLKEVGGAEGVGVSFLEETFGASTAPPEHRYHQKAARAVLKALLPESGTDIKGNTRSYDELLRASEYGNRQKDFDDLIRILDSEVRLITPTDPQSVAADEDSANQANSGQKYFQLTHDYLVRPLRDWLTRKQKETRRGRAELRLLDRMAAWNAKPESRQLPSLWEFLNIRLFTDKKKWTEPQRKMMGKAGRVHRIRSALAALVLVTMIIAGREISGRIEANSLVQQLLSADIAQVPDIVEKINGCRRWADPVLKAKDPQLTEDSSAKLHAALALLPVDESKLAYLRDQLLVVTPIQFPVVRDALLAHGPALVEPMWAIARDTKREAKQRFQAACALAAFAPDDRRWSDINTFVAGHLVALQTSDRLAWRGALHQARRQLCVPLAIVYRDASQDQQRRSLAAETLAAYAADKPDDLFNLLADSERFQFPVLFDRLAAHKSRVAGLAKSELSKQAEEMASEDERERLAKRQVNAAVALLRLGDPENVWPLLRHSPDPTARSFFIHWLSRLGGDPKMIIQRLNHEPDVTIRRALVLTLGGFSESQLPAEERERLVANLLMIYEREPDAGLHATAEWLLRKWGQAEQLTARVEKLRTKDGQRQARKATEKRQWYINSQGQTMVVVEAGEFLMGSPASEADRLKDELQHERRVKQRFAIAALEVTKEQFDRFQRERAESEIARPETVDFVKTDDSPQGAITWYEAVAYCNWLSEKEGIPQSQWCYEPNSEGTYAAGMKAKANYLELSGYRLPTEAEWEFACRAGTRTSRFFGSSEMLLPQYVWYLANAQKRTWPVGSLKPNDAGLFDMQGNVAEWCHDRYTSYPIGDEQVIEDAGGMLPVADTDSRVLRGGEFGHLPMTIRSAFRNGFPPSFRDFIIGFRPCRTYR